LIAGCATQGGTFDERLASLDEAVEGCLAADLEDFPVSPGDTGLQIAV
jgi:predicted RNase H-like HicB family nuclease